LTDKLPEELGAIATSFAPTRAMARGGVAGVTIEVAFVVEEKMTFTLLLVMVVVIPVIDALRT
jgi:hypothetical protein